MPLIFLLYIVDVQARFACTFMHPEDVERNTVYTALLGGGGGGGHPVAIALVIKH